MKCLTFVIRGGLNTWKCYCDVMSKWAPQWSFLNKQNLSCTTPPTLGQVGLFAARKWPNKRKRTTSRSHCLCYCWLQVFSMKDAIWCWKRIFKSLGIWWFIHVLYTQWMYRLKRNTCKGMYTALTHCVRRSRVMALNRGKLGRTVAILLPLTSPCQTCGSFCQPRLTPLCPHCWLSVSPLLPLLPFISPVFVPLLPHFLLHVCPFHSSFHFLKPFFSPLHFFFSTLFSPSSSLSHSPPPLFSSPYAFFSLPFLSCPTTLITSYQLDVTLSHSDLSLTSPCCLSYFTV